MALPQAHVFLLTKRHYWNFHSIKWCLFRAGRFSLPGGWCSCSHNFTSATFKLHKTVKRRVERSKSNHLLPLFCSTTTTLILVGGSVSMNPNLYNTNTDEKGMQVKTKKNPRWNWETHILTPTLHIFGCYVLPFRERRWVDLFFLGH